MIDLIKKLTEGFGPSGNEDQIREIISSELSGHVDSLTTDVMGNLVAVKRGAGPRIMLAAHMDEIGVVITHIDEKGFLRFATVGGVRTFMLIGHRVRFANGSFGVIGSERRESPSEEVKLDKLFIDIGATDRASAEAMVKVGDFASFWRDFTEVNGRLVAKALDDRIGCAVLIQVLKALPSTPNEVIAVFTTQEEIGPRGARTSAYHTDPVMAIAVDVTLTGDTPESEKMEVAIGKGPAIKVKDYGMIANPKVKNLLVDTATAAGIPYQLEVLIGGTTDASVIQTTKAGIPSGVVSIPCRYVHSPSEMVDRGDVEMTVKLLVELLKKPLPEM